MSRWMLRECVLECEHQLAEHRLDRGGLEPLPLEQVAQVAARAELEDDDGGKASAATRTC